MPLVILVIKYIKGDDDLEEEKKKKGTRNIWRITIYQNTAFQNCHVQVGGKILIFPDCYCLIAD